MPRPLHPPEKEEREEKKRKTRRMKRFTRSVCRGMTVTSRCLSLSVSLKSSSPDGRSSLQPRDTRLELLLLVSAPNSLKDDDDDKDFDAGRAEGEEEAGPLTLVISSSTSERVGSIGGIPLGTRREIQKKN